MLKLRIKQKYLLLSCAIFFIGIYFAAVMNGFNLFGYITHFYPDEYSSFEEYKKMIYSFDNFIINASHFFMFLIPIIAIIPTIHFKEELEHYYFHSMIRKNSYKKEMIKSILINALIIASVLYLTYIVCLIFSNFLFPIRPDNRMIQTVLDDVIGSYLFNHNRLLHYIVTGIVEIFMPIFLISFASMVTMLVIDKKNIAMLFTFSLYIFLVVFWAIVVSFIPHLFIYYLNPSYLCTLNSFVNFSTPYTLMSYTIYLGIGFIVLLIALNSKEKRIL